MMGVAILEWSEADIGSAPDRVGKMDSFTLDSKPIWTVSSSTLSMHDEKRVPIHPAAIQA